METSDSIEVINRSEDVEGVFIFVETFKGEIVPVSFEIIGIARKLADKLNTFVAAVHLGSNKEDLKKDAQQLIAYGANKVILVNNDKFNHSNYITLPYTHAIHEIIKAKQPEIFLFGATTTGRDLAPRIAARCNSGLSADCTAFDISDYYHKKTKTIYKQIPNFIRPSFAEAKLATILGNPTMWKYPQMGTARPGVFAPLAPDSARRGSVEFFEVEFHPNDFNVRIQKSITETQDFVDFDRAQIIISGGAGVGRKGFKLLIELVDAINENGQKCELGASRSAVEAGWINRSHQIGQTGRTVRPEIYIAVGISGAIQHIEGMKNSKRIIAINRDSNASIFKYSDLGIVDNYQNILPLLLKKIKDGYLFPSVH